MMKVWPLFRYLSSLVMLFLGAGVLTDAGAAPIVIDEETRTIRTDLITVQWDVNGNERISRLELNSAPGVNLTLPESSSLQFRPLFTGASWICISRLSESQRSMLRSFQILPPSMSLVGRTPIGQWHAYLLDDQGTRAEVVVKSQRPDCAPVTTIYEFEHDSAVIRFQRTFHFSIEPFTPVPNGLIPYVWYMKGRHLPFTYSRTDGGIGSGTSRFWGKPILYWDGRWADVDQITYFHGPQGPPCLLYACTDFRDTRVSPILHSIATYTEDITICGGLFLHEKGISVEQIEQEYDKFLDTFTTTTVTSDAYRTKPVLSDYDYSEWDLLIYESITTSTINAMCEDRNGVMWFAHGNGVTKYDGWQWTTFGPKEFKGVEKKDDLYVFDTLFFPVMKFPQYCVVDQYGKLWVCEYDGNCIRVFNPDGSDLSFSPISSGLNSTSKATAARSPSGIAAHPDGTIYVTLDNAKAAPLYEGILKFDSLTGNALPGIELGFRPGDLDLDDDGNMFIVEKFNDRWHVFTQASDYATSYSFGSGTANHTNRGIAVTNDGSRVFIACETDGKIHKWIGGVSSGVANYTQAADLTWVTGLSGAVDVDNNDYIFVCDYGNNAVKVFDGAENLVETISLNIPPHWDRPRGVGFNHDSSYIYTVQFLRIAPVQRWKRYQPGVEKKGGQREIKNIEVRDIAEVGSGSIWAATNRGLFQHEEESWVPVIDNNWEVGESVYDIHEAKDGSIWVTTDRGIACCNDGEWNFHTGEEIGVNKVTKIFELDDGSLWFATDNQGTLAYTNKTWKLYKSADGLGSNVALDVCQDKDGYIWVATENGARQFDGEEWKTIGADDGLLSKRVYFVRKAPDGSLWFGCEEVNILGEGRSGTCRYDGNGWICFEPRASYNLGMSFCQTRDGSIWIGTDTGLMRFDGSDWDTDAITAGLFQELAITHIYQAKDGSIWLMASLRRPQVRTVVARYGLDNEEPKVLLAEDLPETWKYADYPVSATGMDKWDMTKSEDLRYSFRLDDGDWSPPRRESAFWEKDLKHGAHTLSVKVSDGRNNESEPLSYMFYKVSKPFYRTRGFIRTILIALFIALLSLAFAYYKTRVSMKLKEVDELKSEFVSNVSHELRTPLTTIKGAIDNILDGITGSITEKQHKYLTRLKDNTDRLSRLIDDILDITRIESGRVKIEPVLVSVGEVAQRTVEAFQPLAAEKKIHLTMETKEPIPKVRADRDRLSQILTNLLNNALKFTPEDGKIKVNIGEAEKGWVRVAVQDTGQGIPEEQLARIFDRFHQVSSKSQFRAKGTGLGLAICKSLVELHGGKIWATSETGKGSTFYLTLPAAKKS